MPDWLGLEDKRVVIAGGAGTLGAALVTGYEDAGAHVTVLDLKNGDDLSTADGCRTALAKLGDEPIDVFVHAVGINRRKPIEEYDDDDWDDIVAVNLSSAFYTARRDRAAHARPGRTAGSCSSASVAGRSGHKHHGPYAATKGAINQLMRVMAHEHAADGVTVNAVAPGYMDTELTRQYLADHPGRREELIDADPGRAVRARRRGRRPGPVPVLAAGELHHRDGSVHRRRTESCV